MNYLIKTIAPTTILFVICVSLFPSCMKTAPSYDSYFYLSKSVQDSTRNIKIDGTDYGKVQFISTPVSVQSLGIKYVKLPSGHHNIVVCDGNNKIFITTYVDIQSSTMMQGGNCGNPGGGACCSRDNNNNLMVALSE